VDVNYAEKVYTWIVLVSQVQCLDEAFLKHMFTEMFSQNFSELYDEIDFFERLFT
jgi:hypothetical protein